MFSFCHYHLFLRNGNLSKSGSQNGVPELAFTPFELSRRLPKQTVHPARTRRMNETKVNQKPAINISYGRKEEECQLKAVSKGERNSPGPVTVWASTFNLSISCFTSAYNAISIANAMRVITAVKNEMMEARRVAVRWEEKERRRATKDATAATG
jgi:hypothetical protein